MVDELSAVTSSATGGKGAVVQLIVGMPPVVSDVSS
jgi:hypothetical protein